MIDIQGIPRTSQLRSRIFAQLDKALAPLRVAPVSVRVTFSDENGPRGGIGVRCALVVRVPRRPVLRVIQQAATPRRAFDESFDTLARQLARYREQRAERQRRPKKYYAARRLLQEGLAPEATD